MEPLVTIIIPSYNHARYLESAIKSALDQTYDNIEVIITDDGSTDGSRELLHEKYSSNERIKLFLNVINRGHAITINEVLKEAKGEYISFLSSDDWYLPTKIAKQVEKFRSLDDSYGCVYSGGYRYFEESDEMIEVETNMKMRKGYILKYLLTEPFFIYPISPLIKKKCLDEYPFTPRFKAEGEAIHFKIAMRYKYDFIDEPLVVMRDHPNNTGKKMEMMITDNVAYHDELFTHPEFPLELRYLKRKILSRIYSTNGWDLIRTYKEYEKGRTALLDAIRVDKTQLVNPRVLIGIMISYLKW